MTKILKVADAERQLQAQLKRGDTAPVFVELARAVGVDILDTVSSDLYKNAFHVVRELIQNSYDEKAENVEFDGDGCRPRRRRPRQARSSRSPLQ